MQAVGIGIGIGIAIDFRPFVSVSGAKDLIPTPIAKCFICGSVAG
jgi:hypothetical protein